MQVTISLDEDDVRICRSIVVDLTHFILNSSCIEDAVISGILTQISKKNIAPSKDMNEKELETFASLVSKKLWGEKE